MNTKLNIDELKFLVPDYVTGDISDSDKLTLEKAMNESQELAEFYLQVKDTFSFVSTVKTEEPQPHYWSSLLPRIHQKIEEKNSKPAVLDNIISYWKVIVPVAAIILFAVIYYSVKPTDSGIVKDVKNPVISNDSNNNKSDNDIKINNDKITEESNSSEDNNSIDNKASDKQVKNNANNTKKKYSLPRNSDEKIVKKENRDKYENPDEIKETFTDQALDQALDIDEEYIFAGNESLGLDEELESDLKKLNDSEKNTLLEELINANL